MIDWNKELEEIFRDPLFDDVTAPRKRTTSSDRLIAGFQEICDYAEAHGCPPTEETDRKLYRRLKGILGNESKMERCRPFDTCGLLPLPETEVVSEPKEEYKPKELTEEEQLEEIMNDPLFDDIESGGDPGLFDIPDYMRQRLNARKEAEYVGKRRECEDFDKYADGFKEIHVGLKSGKYRLVKFSVKNLKPGSYFVEDGMIGYLAAFEDEGVNRYGDRDGRTRVIYENGSESDIKYKTITKNLSVTGYSVIDTSEISNEEFEQCFTLNDNDVESGTIYVLRSKSTRPEIAAIKDLYKIGFTVTSVESRIANARNEPTYLCADVEVVATWKAYNVKSSTFEALIHKLFAAVQLQVTVDGHRPKEWFMFPFTVIEQAVVGIIRGEAMMYDPQLRQLVMLNSHPGMKCLSVKQPWASFICMGMKDVENRSWHPKEAPGRILIHASATLDRYAQDEAEDIVGHPLPPLLHGAIIGYVEVYGFTQHSDSIWAGEGHGSKWKWLLRNAKMFKEPIPYKGKRNIFTVPEIDPENLPETI